MTAYHAIPTLPAQPNLVGTDQCVRPATTHPGSRSATVFATCNRYGPAPGRTHRSAPTSGGLSGNNRRAVIHYARSQSGTLRSAIRRNEPRPYAGAWTGQGAGQQEKVQDGG